MVLSDFTERFKSSWQATTRTLTGRYDDYRVILGDVPIPVGTLRIPCDVRRENTVLLALSGLRLANSVAVNVGARYPGTASPGSIALASALSIAHVRAHVSNWSIGSDGSNATLHRMSMNPYRVVEKGEYYRLITSQAHSPSTTSFLTHVSDLIESMSIIESAWGTWEALLGVLSASGFGQLLYVGLADLARSYYPELALAKQYYRYSTGLAITSIAARTMSGYVQDMQGSSKQAGSFRYRYGWSMHVLLTNTLLRLSAGYFAGEAGRDMRPYALLESPSIWEVTCGVVSGMVVASSRTGCRESLGLVLLDVVLQGILLASCAATYGEWVEGGV